MAAPVHLKANTPGGNSYASSRRNQRTKDGVVQNQRFKPALRANKGKVAADPKAAYSAGKSVMRPMQVPKAVLDYTSRWMAAKGLNNPQAKTGRIRYASMPADQVSSGGGSGSSRKARVNPSGKTQAKRVKTSYTGRSYSSTRRPRLVSAKGIRRVSTKRASK